MGKAVEKVNKFKYLEYVFLKNGGQETQIKDRIKMGAAVMSMKDWKKEI